MRAPRVRMALCGLAIAASAIAAPPEPAAPALDAVFATGRLTLPLEALASRYPLAPGKDFQVAEIGRDAHSSHHAVWIVDLEIPHRHDRHDLFVVMLRGHGAMRLGDEERPVGEGSILYVPRGTPHAFRNASGAPALAYAIYSPAFDGRDRVPLD